MKDPIIVIDMEGGLIQRIRTTEPVRVIVLDLDVNDAQADDVRVIEGHESVVTAAFDTELLPNMVQKVVDEVDAPLKPCGMHSWRTTPRACA